MINMVEHEWTKSTNLLDKQYKVTIGKRHVCSKCRKKKYERFMREGYHVSRFGFIEWFCKDCSNDGRSKD